MNWKSLFTSLKLKNGITFGFIFALIVTIASSFSSIIYTQNLYNGLKTMYQKDILGANTVQKARYDLLSCDNCLKSIMLRSQLKQDVAQELNQLSKSRASFLTNLDKADPLFKGRKSQELLNNTRATSAEYFKLVDLILTQLQSTPEFETEEISLNETEAVFQKAEALLRKMDNLKQNRNLSFYKTTLIVYQTNIAILGIVLALSIAVRVALYWKTIKTTKIQN